MNAARKAVVGVDTAKSVFQAYTVEKETGEVINNPIKRAQFLQWFPTGLPAWSGWKPVAARSTGRTSSRNWDTK